jgi:hypothetical protein
MAISLLGDAAEPFLASRRVLPWHKSDPCRKIPTGFEVTRICDGGSDSRGSITPILGMVSRRQLISLAR